MEQILIVMLIYSSHSVQHKHLYLIKLLRQQGLPLKQLNIVFKAIITPISRIQYVVSAWGGFVTYDIKRKIMLSFHVQIDLGFAIILHSILYCLRQITRYISLSVILSIV